MAETSTYLNFQRETEAAFTFYKSVFGTEFDGIARFGDIPPMEGMPGPSDADKNLIANIQLPITGGHILMGSDVPESMGMTLTQGNNVYIMVRPDTRAEADRLFTDLSDGGSVEMPMAIQFWGDYFGSFVDKFGVHWMINTTATS